MMLPVALLAGLLLQTFDPFPNGTSSYHINFTRIFASADAEKADRAALQRDLETLQTMRGAVTSDAAHLLRVLELNDAVQIRLARHSMVLYLRYAVDTRDEKNRDDREALESEVDAKTAFIQDEILRVPAERLAALMSAEPKLETYRYAID